MATADARADEGVAPATKDALGVAVDLSESCKDQSVTSATKISKQTLTPTVEMAEDMLSDDSSEASENSISCPSSPELLMVATTGQEDAEPDSSSMREVIASQDLPKVSNAMQAGSQPEASTLNHVTVTVTIDAQEDNAPKAEKRSDDLMHVKAKPVRKKLGASKKQKEKEQQVLAEKQRVAEEKEKEKILEDMKKGASKESEKEKEYKTAGVNSALLAKLGLQPTHILEQYSHSNDDTDKYSDLNEGETHQDDDDDKPVIQDIDVPDSYTSADREAVKHSNLQDELEAWDKVEQMRANEVETEEVNQGKMGVKVVDPERRNEQLNYEGALRFFRTQDIAALKKNIKVFDFRDLSIMSQARVPIVVARDRPISPGDSYCAHVRV